MNDDDPNKYQIRIQPARRFAPLRAALALFGAFASVAVSFVASFSGDRVGAGVWLIAALMWVRRSDEAMR